jgi:AraC-like DNA-binding protein
VNRGRNSVLFDKRDMPLRFNSMFMRTIFVLCMLITINGCIFYYFLNKEYEEKFIQKQSAAGFFSMVQYSSEVSNLLADGMSRMDGIFQQPDCRRLIIAGNELPETAHASVMRMLSALVTDGGYFDSALIYLRHTDKVLLPDGTVADAASSGIKTVLDNGISGLFNQDGDMYLCRVYPAKKPVAVIACRIEPRQFYDEIGMINLPRKGISRIYLYDSDGTAVFSESIMYPEAAEISAYGEEKGAVEEENCHVFRSNGSYVLSFEDSKNGLVYMQILDALNGLALEESLPTMLVFLGAAIVLLLAASYYLSCYAFSPFRESIMALVANKAPEKIEEIRENSANEFDLIKNIARDDELQQRRQLVLMQSARGAIAANLMEEMITGVGRSRSEIKEIMRDIASPFPEKGRYLVFVHYCDCSDAGDSADLKDQMFRLETEAFAREFWKDKALVRSLPAKDKHLFVVLCLNGDKDYTDEITRYGAELKKRLASYGQRMAGGVSHEGKSVYELKELSEAALTDMRRKIYYSGEDAAAEEADGQKAVEEQVARTVFDKLTGKEAEEYADDPEKMRGLFVDVIASYPEKAEAVFELLIDYMTEKMIRSQLRIPSKAVSMKERALRGSGQWQEDDDRFEAFCGFFEVCLGENFRRSNNDKFHYIDSTVKLIHERYYDNTMSLESVSSELGLSPQYLSRLFASRQSEGFLAYLNRYRLGRAKELLIHTGYSISEIGLKTGFNSSQSFIRVFKRYEQMTPGQFRKEHEQEASGQLAENNEEGIEDA